MAWLLAGFFFFLPAAMSVVGRAYFWLIGLTIFTAGVNVFLVPAILIPILVAVIHSRSRLRLRLLWPRRDLARTGLIVWVTGAALATVANLESDFVVLAFVSVYLTAVLVYLVFRRIRLSPGQFELIAAALCLGSLLPMVSGLIAFTSQWGIPSFQAVMQAHRAFEGVSAYEAATFWSRGNTASFLSLVGPLLMWLVVDPTRTRKLRVLAAVSLPVLLANVFILQQRSAFLAVSAASFLIWFYIAPPRRALPAAVASLGLVLYATAVVSPEAWEWLGERFVPALTWDAGRDNSVTERAEAMAVAWEMGLAAGPVGIGPAAALSQHPHGSAHQFILQQFLETGLLGVIGAALFAGAVFALAVNLIRQARRGHGNPVAFGLAIGPACFLLVAMTADVTLAAGYVNTWIALAVGMVALAGAAQAPLGTVPSHTAGASWGVRRNP